MRARPSRPNLRALFQSAAVLAAAAYFAGPFGPLDLFGLTPSLSWALVALVVSLLVCVPSLLLGDWPSTRFDWLIAGYLVVIAITGAIGVNRVQSVQAAIVEVSQIGFFYATIAAARRSPSLAGHLLLALAVGAAVVEMMALGYHLDLGLATRPKEYPIPAGWSGYPELGVLGGLQLGVLTGAVLAAEKPLERVAIALLALVASAEIIVLYSRSAWIGALGIAALALVLNRRHRLVFMVTAAGAMVLAALVMFTNPTMRVLAGNLIGASAPPDAPSIEMAAPNDRIKIWSETLAMIRDVPLHGVGLGNFQAVFERQYNPLPNSDQRRGVHAHNLWLQRTAELGVVGGLWFAAMWAALLWAAWQSARRRATAVTLGVLLSLVGITLSNMTDVVAGEVGGSRLCLLNWMLFGLAAGASQDERQS